MLWKLLTLEFESSTAHHFRSYLTVDSTGLVNLLLEPSDQGSVFTGLLLLTVAEDVGGPFGECFLPSSNMVVVRCIPGGQMVHRLLALHRLQRHRGPKNRSVVPTSLRHFLLIHEGNSCPQVWSRILTCLPVQFSKSASA